jgi:SAM-dependent methyltransferase
VSRPTFDDVAAAYDEFMGQWTRVYVPALLRAAHVSAGQRVLDMATGTGEAALMAADAVGARGTIVGVDVSLPMLRGALAKPRARRIRLAAMDGQVLALRHETFDTVISQLGLMFFLIPSPASARRGGCCVPAAASRHSSENVLAEAGLRGVSVTAETQTFRFASFDDYWRHVESGAIRIGVMLRELPPETVRAVRGRVRESVAPSSRAMDWSSPRSRSSAADPHDPSARGARPALGLARRRRSDGARSERRLSPARHRRDEQRGTISTPIAHHTFRFQQPACRRHSPCSLPPEGRRPCSLA